MLVLQRKPGETIVINDDIRVSVLSVTNEGRFVKLGVDAPKDVSIHREEVWETIKREEDEANKS